MSDASEESDNKGFRINTKGISCIPCRCKRQFYHKETKTVKENNIITTNTVVDKRNTKFGGRNVSPDETGIFQSDGQMGSVEICDTGWNSKESRITPEELLERVECAETEITLLKKDITEIKKDIDDINNFKVKVD